MKICLLALFNIKLFLIEDNILHILNEYNKRFECKSPFLCNIQLRKFENIYIVISNSKSFVPQILKVVSPFGKKLIYFSPLGSVIQIDYDSETSEFKLHSFRVFERYLTDKNPIEEQHQFFQFSTSSF